MIQIFFKFFPTLPSPPSPPSPWVVCVPLVGLLVTLAWDAVNGSQATLLPPFPPLPLPYPSPLLSPPTSLTFLLLSPFPSPPLPLTWFVSHSLTDLCLQRERCGGWPPADCPSPPFPPHSFPTLPPHLVCVPLVHRLVTPAWEMRRLTSGRLPLPLRVGWRQVLARTSNCCKSRKENKRRNPFTPTFKKYILPTFFKRNV